MTGAGGQPGGRRARDDGHRPGSRAARRAFTLGVRRLRSRPGSREEVHLSGSIPEMAVLDAWVPEDAEVRFDGFVESAIGGVTVAGRVTAPWSATCRRCLEPASGVLVAEVRELCRDPVAPAHGASRMVVGRAAGSVETGAGEDEYYPVGPDELDVQPIVRDACILELPLAPLCSESCRGLCPGCGANLNEGECSCEHPVEDGND